VAVKLEAVWRARLIEQRYLPSTPRSVPTLRIFWAEEFLPWFRPRHRPSTVRRYEKSMAVILSVLGDLRLDEISEFGVERYKSTRLTLGRATSTVNMELLALRDILNRAVDWECTPPYRKRPGKQLPEDAEHDRFLSNEEEARWVPACAPHLVPAVIFALYTGLRVGEVQAMTWSWVDLSAGRMTVPARASKGRHADRVPLNETALGVLRGQGGYRRDAGFPLVASADTSILQLPMPQRHVFLNHLGQPRRQLGQAFTAAARRAGWEDVSFHTLRHTFGSRLAQRGENAKTIMQLMRHRHIKTTERYLHLADEHLQVAVRKLDA
jgi:integrase